MFKKLKNFFFGYILYKLISSAFIKFEAYKAEQNL